MLNGASVLYIPVHLIWRIKVRWTQKFLLAISLCLTVFVIAVTLVRASGLRAGSNIDSVWKVYWSFIAAEVGLIMAAATAFRSIFVARASERAQAEHNKEWEWHYQKKRLLRRVLPFTAKGSTTLPSFNTKRVGRIPRGTMTGLKTFFSRFDRATNVTGQPTANTAVGNDELGWPLNPSVTRVSHERVCPIHRHEKG
jgi:hypothetical protein